jgi:flagellar hook-associated protein 2
MSIQSLGVGSGLDLEGLVSQLLQAERAPKTQRLNTREAEIESTISGL